jgi:hypothetical protein
MPEFMPAEKLLNIFEVFGHFYSVNFPNGQSISCRSVLEIISKEISQELGHPNRISHLQPDAIFIMMNTGSSYPLRKDINNSIPSSNIHNLPIILEYAHPDPTQYQIMRIMHYKNWGHARILNLSDLRNPTSGSFFSNYREVEDYPGGEIHSLFSSQRKIELNRKLNRKNSAPIVCAWGVDDNLDLLISRCLKSTNHMMKCGVIKSGAKDKYYHPLPFSYKKQK